MYLSSRRTAVAAAGGADAEPTAPDSGEGRVPGNVLALGTVSLITDISSEMVSAVLPVYLVFGLGVSLLAVGFVDGLYAGVVVLVSLLAAHVADRTQHRKAVAGAGYGLSAVSKLGLLAVGSSVGGIATVIGVDRVGKGLRTAPRDALISLSSSAESLGRSFGVHRAMDTAGALAGPLVAFFILKGIPEGYDAVFVVSFCVALAGLVVLVAFVRNKRDPLADRSDVSLRAGLVLLGRPVFRRVTVRATLLSVVTLSDAFVYLLLQHQLDVSLVYFPLLPLGTPSSTCSGRCRPAGSRTGGGAGVSSWPATSPCSGSTRSCWHRSRSSRCSTLVLALHGVYYAGTNGVLMALVAPSVPAALRSSGMAIVQTGIAAGAFVSSVVAGALWSWRGPAFAVSAFLVGLVVVLAATALPSNTSPSTSLDA